MITSHLPSFITRQLFILILSPYRSFDFIRLQKDEDENEDDGEDEKKRRYSRQEQTPFVFLPTCMEGFDELKGNITP